VVPVDHPPINTITATTELAELVGLIELARRREPKRRA
jgi:hypothetical protein